MGRDGTAIRHNYTVPVVAGSVGVANRQARGEGSQGSGERGESRRTVHRWAMDASQELADLQNRFHLLEGDRKAFYEQSQLTLKQNKEICDELRRENKELRAALGGAGDKKAPAGHETSAMQEAELARVEAQLTQLRQRQNQVACGNKLKEKMMHQLEDELRDLQRSSSRPAHEANPLMRQIRTLENRLDKAMIKYNEAQSIRKTYDQIVKRLKEERVNFDNQVALVRTAL